MKRNIVRHTGRNKGVDCPTGELLITKLSRAMNSGEPIEGGAVLASTERKDGVLPQFNIRTDRFETALEAYDKIAAAHIAQRDNYINPKSKSDDSKSSDESGDQGADNKSASSSNSSGDKGAA